MVNDTTSPGVQQRWDGWLLGQFWWKGIRRGNGGCLQKRTDVLILQFLMHNHTPLVYNSMNSSHAKNIPQRLPRCARSLPSWRFLLLQPGHLLRPMALVVLMQKLKGLFLVRCWNCFSAFSI